MLVTVAAMAPTNNWPSAPILNNPVLKAKPTDNPVNVIGRAVVKNSPTYLALNILSVNNLSKLIPVIVLARALKAPKGLIPVNSITMVPIKKLRRIAMIGTVILYFVSSNNNFFILLICNTYSF